MRPGPKPSPVREALGACSIVTSAPGPTHDGVRTPDDEVWELHNLDEDWSQANDLADQMPDNVAQMKEIFLIEATRNQALPIGGGLWVGLHPEFR